jgi:galactose-1-phosphate uridylyltransferase
LAFIGIGHLFPSIEVWAKRMDATPWELTPEELDGWSDLLHAVHVATGPAVPTNEEWHYRPPEVRGRIPLRAIVKWRINTPAGFEGGTKIHINTIDPWTLRDRVRVGIETGLAGGLVADTVRLTGAVGGGP